MTPRHPSLRLDDFSPQLCGLTLDRPPANALTSDLIEAIADIVRSLAQREAPPVLLLAATGERFFCAGGDIKELDDGDVDHALRRMEKFHHMLAALTEYPTAIVAAVRGYAAGGGLELTLMADLVIAGERAQFGFPEIRNGLMPAVMGIQRAVDTIGRRAAFDLLSSGRFVTAPEAVELGLAHRVVADREVLAHATDVATALSERDPVIMAILKRAVHGEQPDSPDTMRRQTLTGFREILDRPASVEARQKFLARNKV